jgi:hypothetical protein
MWIFSIYGFYSIACADNPDGSLDCDAVMVRARCKDHLKNLQARFPELTSSEIVSWPNRDYRYRLLVPKSTWVRALQGMAEEQEWNNFKNEVTKRQGRDGHAYGSALHDVWEILYLLQESETRQSRS